MTRLVPILAAESDLGGVIGKPTLEKTAGFVLSDILLILGALVLLTGLLLLIVYLVKTSGQRRRRHHHHHHHNSPPKSVQRDEGDDEEEEAVDDLEDTPEETRFRVRKRRRVPRRDHRPRNPTLAETGGLPPARDPNSPPPPLV